MTKLTTMSEAYPEGAIGDGLFSDLQSEGIPWESADIAEQLDILYYSRSGEKPISPLLSSRLSDEDFRAVIAKAVRVMFSTKWTKLYDVLSLQYNPIENYRMSETENLTRHDEANGTDTGTVRTQSNGEKTDNGTISTTARVDKTDGGTISNVTARTDGDSVYGFNSSDAVNSGVTDIDEQRTETRNLTLGEDSTSTETHNLAYTEDSDGMETRNLANSSESDGTEERELLRSGNIGVTTSQQLIQSELDLWEWNYFSTVFADVDSVLTLDIYQYEMGV